MTGLVWPACSMHHLVALVKVVGRLNVELDHLMSQAIELNWYNEGRALKAIHRVYGIQYHRGFTNEKYYLLQSFDHRT